MAVMVMLSQHSWGVWLVREGERRLMMCEVRRGMLNRFRGQAVTGAVLVAMTSFLGRVGCGQGVRVQVGRSRGVRVQVSEDYKFYYAMCSL